MLLFSRQFVWLFATPWTAGLQASLSLTVSQSLPKFTSIASVMPSNHLILCCPLLLPSIFPSIRVFFQWVGCLYQLAKVLELQHQSFQWVFSVFLNSRVYSYVISCNASAQPCLKESPYTISCLTLFTLFSSRYLLLLIILLFSCLFFFTLKNISSIRTGTLSTLFSAIFLYLTWVINS